MDVFAPMPSERKERGKKGGRMEPQSVESIEEKEKRDLRLSTKKNGNSLLGKKGEETRALHRGAKKKEREKKGGGRYPCPRQKAFLFSINPPSKPILLPE